MTTNWSLGGSLSPLEGKKILAIISMKNLTKKEEKGAL